MADSTDRNIGRAIASAEKSRSAMDREGSSVVQGATVGPRTAEAEREVALVHSNIAIAEALIAIARWTQRGGDTSSLLGRVFS